MDLSPAASGRVGRWVEVATANGRDAGPWQLHTEVLLDLLGWDGCSRATATGEHDDGRAIVVPGARKNDVLLLGIGPERVAEVDLHHAAVEVIARPSLVDPSTCEVRFGPDAVRRTWGLDVGHAHATAAVVMAADAAGAAQAALDAALDHVRAREQYNAPLATLQAVQHRAADMAIDVRLATDAVLDAAGVIDRGEPDELVLLAAAHAKLGVARSQRVTASAHQLAGGQGILESSPFHRWHRRTAAAGVLLGDQRHHRAVVGRAALAGHTRFG
jgi:alkylation response protein AidB-like acyl-CoA dehydrogenase